MNNVMMVIILMEMGALHNVQLKRDGLVITHNLLFVKRLVETDLESVVQKVVMTEII